MPRLSLDSAEEGFFHTGGAVYHNISSLWAEFMDFIDNGNVLGLAVGIMLGSSFQSVVTSAVDDILMPPIGLGLGNNFANLFLVLQPGQNGTSYNTIQQAKEDGAVTWNYGRFLQVSLNFIVLSFILFWLVRLISKIGREDIMKPKKKCPYCRTSIPQKATKCSACGSWVEERKDSGSSKQARDDL
ncbi:hypothetical protein BZG36_00527 [Bifiguratus adelaidae]|uniref:Large-conductance mechanosensitive channel n=1 Tax=Bifiguratus adelaidae TaxID=1938954 RepID=A0A261Y7H7_9FUNG|nr:hypothetical protein BZG36_00527 [Bifiguratus adelaidae]